MARKIVDTKSGPLTENDFVGEAQAPGSSDKAYSAKAKAGFADLAARVAQQAADARKNQ